jgi:large subunit ribosomal protein L18
VNSAVPACGSGHPWLHSSQSATTTSSSRSAFEELTMNKNENRLRRAKSTRSHIRKLAVAAFVGASHRAAHLCAGVRRFRPERGGCCLHRAEVGCRRPQGHEEPEAAAAVGKAVAERAWLQVSSPWHSIAPASVTTAASRHWPMRRAKRVSSSKQQSLAIPGNRGLISPLSHLQLQAAQPQAKSWFCRAHGKEHVF